MLWDSLAIGLCKIVPHAFTGTEGRVLSAWDLGSGLVSKVPYLGVALGVVGD